MHPSFYDLSLQCQNLIFQRIGLRTMSSLVLEVVWFLAFLISLVASNCLCSIIKGFISSLPAGDLSLFVHMMNDLYTGIHFHTSIHCILGMVSRFEPVTAAVAGSNAAAVVIGSLIELMNTSMLVHLGLLCIIRILCLKYISFMEETLGEKIIRITLLSLSFAAAVINCTALIVSGDILSGTVYNVMTNTVSVSGD